MFPSFRLDQNDGCTHDDPLQGCSSLRSLFCLFSFSGQQLTKPHLRPLYTVSGASQITAAFRHFLLTATDRSDKVALSWNTKSVERNELFFSPVWVGLSCFLFPLEVFRLFKVLLKHFYLGHSKSFLICPSMCITDVSKKIEGQVDAPPQLFQKVIRNRGFLLCVDWCAGSSLAVITDPKHGSFVWISWIQFYNTKLHDMIIKRGGLKSTRTCCRSSTGCRVPSEKISEERCFWYESGEPQVCQSEVLPAAFSLFNHNC